MKLDTLKKIDLWDRGMLTRHVDEANKDTYFLVSDLVMQVILRYYQNGHINTAEMRELMAYYHKPLNGVWA